MSHHEKGLATVLGAVKHDVYIIPVCTIALNYYYYSFKIFPQF